MTRHIHIYIHRSTRDAGFDEAKHNRDHGKFATTSHGDASKHLASSQRVHMASMKLGFDHEHFPTLRKAMAAHLSASANLDGATLEKDPAKKQAYLAKAQSKANEAETHERLAAASKRPEDKADYLAKAAQHRASVKR